MLARPRPATVGPRADAARTATASIGREGGTLAATGADGTRYTLTVPAGALLDATTVTMTPVASIARLPMRARLAGAVQLGPSGRRLLKPASLSITPSRPPARTQLTGFGFASGGGQFHLTPATRTGSDITLRLVELKGHGIGAAGAAARYAFSRTRLPTELSDQAEQVAAALRRPPGGRGRTAQAGPQDDLSAVLWGMFMSISGAVHSNLDQAVFQFVTFDMIASTQSWPGQRTVLDWRGDLARVFLAGYQTNSVEARLGCATRKDITQMARLLRYKDYLTTSLAPLLALGLFPAGGVIDDALGKCLRFELIYEASIHGANGYGEAVTAKVRSTVPIRMAAPGILETFLGTAPLEVVDYSVGPVDCYTHTWNVTPQNPLVVRRLALRIWREFGMENLPPTIRVNFNLGSLDEQVTHTCEGSSYTDQQHAYDGVAAALLGGAAGADFELSWEGKGSAGEFSSQEFTRSADVDGGSYTGTFVFRLRHDPTL